MLENTKLAFGVYYSPNAIGYMLLFSTISIFFENIYMSLSLFFFPFGMILDDSLKNILEFFELPKFLFMLKIFLSL